MVSGTSAAVVPIRVPTSHLVNGMMNTMRMIKGTERTTLITVFTVKKTLLLRNIPSLLVKTKVTAITMPMTDPKNKAAKTI